LKLAGTDIPADSQFFGKPFVATAMIAEMRNPTGHAHKEAKWRGITRLAPKPPQLI
jgi:hypothetical protein